MYKVFVNNIPIHFQKASTFASNMPDKWFPHLLIDDYLQFSQVINNLDIKQPLYIQSPDPWEALHSFFTFFNWIEAAGGIVKNVNTGKLLFIKRFNKWDIPKGKIEENESASCAAIREIQEECGLQELIIQNSLTPTYHVYFGYGEYMIKKTHWFSLTTEETITKGHL